MENQSHSSGSVEQPGLSRSRYGAGEPNAPQGFPRSARLLKPADFNFVFKNASASSDRYFRVLARENGLERSRLGMAVSRKVDKRAVGRNRLKRVIRESFRMSLSRGRPSPRLDLVVLPRPLSATISNRQLSQSLETHWQRLFHRFERGRAGSSNTSSVTG